MRHVATTVATSVMLTLCLAGASSAGVGDYRLVQGRIALWPPEPFAYGVVVLQTDNGQPFFVDFTPVTAGAIGLQPGDVVAVVGRESSQPDRITALSVERRASMSATATPGWQTVTGTVESVSGSTAIMRLADDRRIALDLSQMAGDRIRVQRGQELTVTGVLLTPTLISARGMAMSSDAPAALPRQ